MNQEVRTRFAPSPTGFMHLGGLRAALYGYLFARKNGGKFILRIEDTDQVRFVEGATEVIYDTLRRCGMNWDEGPDVGGPVGPYIQSQRKELYLPYAQQLVKTGHAYYCFCTKEELEERRAACEARGEVFKYDKHCLHLTQEEIQRKLDAGVPYVIRQNAPTTGETSSDDLVFGHMTFPTMWTRAIWSKPSSIIWRWSAGIPATTANSSPLMNWWRRSTSTASTKRPVSST